MELKGSKKQCMCGVKLLVVNTDMTTEEMWTCISRPYDECTQKYFIVKGDEVAECVTDNGRTVLHRSPGCPFYTNIPDFIVMFRGSPDDDTIRRKIQEFIQNKK